MILVLVSLNNQVQILTKLLTEICKEEKQDSIVQSLFEAYLQSEEKRKEAKKKILNILKNSEFSEI